MSEAFVITDSQVHVWAASTPERPWATKFGGAAHGPPSMPAATVLADMDRAGVRGGLIVPPSFEGDRNDLGLAAAHEHPERFRMLGRFDISDRSIEPHILAGMADPGMLGLRLTFNGQAATWIEDGTAEWFWGFAAENRIPVSFYPPRREQLEALPGIAKRHPNLLISIDHLAIEVDTTDEASERKIAALGPLAAFPNIGVKCSALPNAFPESYSAWRVRGVVDRLLPWFGADRIFWGSDYTRAPERHADYAATVKTFLDGIGHLPSAERRKIMGEALRAWLGWT